MDAEATIQPRVGSGSGDLVPGTGLALVLALALVGWVALLPGGPLPGGADSAYFREMGFIARFQGDLIRSGQWPMINASMLGDASWGFDGFSRALDPVRTVTQIMFGGGRGITLDLVLHLVLGGAFAWAAARRLGLSRAGAGLVTLVHLLGMPMAAHVWTGGWDLIRVNAWLPVMTFILAGDPLAPRFRSALGLAVGMLILQAGPVLAGAGMVVAATVACVAGRAGSSPVPVLMGIGAGLLLGAPAVLGGEYWDGVEPGSGLGLLAWTSSLAPGVFGGVDGVEAFLTGDPDNSTPYLGLMTLLLVVLGLDRGRWGRLGVLGIVIWCVGSLTPITNLSFVLGTWPMALVAGRGLSRVAAGAVRGVLTGGGAFLVLALAIGMALGPAHYRMGPIRTRSALGRAVLSRVPADVVGVPPVSVRAFHRRTDRALRRLSLVALFAAVLLLALGMGVYPPRRLAVLIGLFIGVDLYSWSLSHADVSPLVVSPAITKLAEGLGDEARRTRTEIVTLPPTAPMGLGLRSLSGVTRDLEDPFVELIREGTTPGREIRPGEVRVFLPTAMTRLFGVKSWITPADGSASRRGLVERVKEGFYVRCEDPEALSLAFFSDAVHAVDGPEKARARLVDSGFDPRTGLAVEAERTDPPPGDGGPVSQRVISMGHQRMEIELTPPRHGWVLVTRRYRPGWRLMLDDRPAPLYRALGSVMAFRVNASSGHAVLDYRSPYLLPGWILLLLGATFILWWPTRVPPSDG